MNTTEAATHITKAINANLFRYTPGAKTSTRKMQTAIAAVNKDLPTPLRAYVIDHLYAEFNEAELSGRDADVATYLMNLNTYLNAAGYEGEKFTVEQFTAATA